MAVCAKEWPSLGVILSVAQLRPPDKRTSGTWLSVGDSWDADELDERARRVVMKEI